MSGPALSPEAPRRSHQRGVRLAILLAVLSALSGLAGAASVTVAPVQTRVEIPDGSSGTLAVRVINGTDVAIGGTAGWSVPAGMTLLLPDMQLSLAPGESRIVFASVAVAGGTAAATYDATFTFSPAASTAPAASVTVGIRIPVRVDISTTDLASHVPTNGMHTMRLLVANHGNTTETLRFTADTRPLATVEPDRPTFELAPGENAIVEFGITADVAMSASQRITIETRRAGDGAVLATSRATFMVRASTATLNQPMRQLNFTLRLTGSSGRNFSRLGLGALSASVRGGGWLDDEQTQRLHAAFSVRGTGAFSGSLTYTSPSLDFSVGGVSYDLSAFSFPGEGNGFRTTIRELGSGIALHAYLVTDGFWEAYRGAAAQITFGSQAGPWNASLQYSHDAGLDRGVFTATAETSRTIALPAGGGTAGQDASGSVDRIEAALDTIEAGFVEAQDDQAESGEERAIPEPQVLDDLLAAGETAVSLSAEVEVGIDTIQGVAGIVSGSVAYGPASLSVSANGRTSGFGGSELAGYSLSVLAGMSLTEYVGIPLQVSASYSATDSFNAAGDHVRNSDTFGFGVGLSYEGVRLAAAYTRTMASSPQTGAHGAANRYALSLGTSIRSVVVAAGIRAADSWSMAADGTTQRSAAMAIHARASASLPVGTLRNSASVNLDLLGGGVTRIQAESILTIPVHDGLTRDVRVGIRYRYAPASHQVTGLINWRGDVSPTTTMSAGLQGSFGTGGFGVSGSVGANFQLPNSQVLSVSTRVGYSSNGSFSVSATATYSVPFSIDLAERAGYGTVEGRLLSPTGEPLSGVALAMAGATVATGPDGTFTFIGVPAGTYTLSSPSGLNGYVTQPVLPMQIDVMDRESALIELSAVSAGTVEGVVTFVIPDPEPGVVFGRGDLARETALAGSLRLTLTGAGRTFEATSNPGGHFVFTSLPPGSYTAGVASDLGSLYEVEFSPETLTIAPGQTYELGVAIIPVRREIQFQNGGSQ